MNHVSWESLVQRGWLAAALLGCWVANGVAQDLRPGEVRALPPVSADDITEPVSSIPWRSDPPEVVTEPEEIPTPQGPTESLDEAWLIAESVDQSLESKRWQQLASHSDLLAARAERLPWVNLDNSYNVLSDEPSFYYRTPGLAVPNLTLPTSQDEFYLLGAEVHLPVYTGGRTSHGIGAREAEASACRLELAASCARLKLQVAEEYVAVLRAQEDARVASSKVRSLAGHAHNVELFFDQHRVPRNDLLAAQVALAHAQQEEIQALNRLEIARSAFNRRLGRPLTALVQLRELAIEELNLELEPLTERALRQRPELAQLATRAQALDCQAASQSAKDRPQVELRGGYAYQENRFLSPQGIAAIGAAVTWNLYDGGRDRYQAAALTERAEALRRIQADTVTWIQHEVHRAWLQYNETRRRLQATSWALDRAEENLRVAQHRYRCGAGTNTEVLDAESLRVQSHRDHLHARYDAILASLRLEWTTGDL